MLGDVGPQACIFPSVSEANGRSVLVERRAYSALRAMSGRASFTQGPTTPFSAMPV